MPPHTPHLSKATISAAAVAARRQRQHQTVSDSGRDNAAGTWHTRRGKGEGADGLYRTVHSARAVLGAIGRSLPGRPSPDCAVVPSLALPWKFRHSFVMTKVSRKKCGYCGRRFKPKSVGRPAVFCSSSCRQRAYIRRKANRPHPVELLAKDLADLRFQQQRRAEMWQLLREAGLVDEPSPPPLKRPSRAKPRLRLVDDDS